eukprot:gene5892-biopygen4894
MKVKSSMSLPPDPDSLSQVIKRAHHQAYFWLRCIEKKIYQLEVGNYGWRWCEERRLMTPVWYTGDQLPPSFKSKRRRKIQQDNSDDGNADSEENSLESQPVPRKRKKRVKVVKQAVAEREEDSLEDAEMRDEVPYQADNECFIDSDADAQGSSRWQLPVTSSVKSSWEVSDFASTDDSVDEWMP